MEGGRFEEHPALSEQEGLGELPMKLGGGKKESSESTSSGCFDCNICLEFAVDPVVTLCGHLYCWPCIYKWLEVESAIPQQCPVCKATVSETTLVPLYGRGNTCSNKESYKNGTMNIPRRPAIQHRGQTLAASLIQPAFPPSTTSHRRRHHHQNIDGGDTMPLDGVSQLMGSAAVAVLPWVFGEHISTGLQYSNRYFLVGDEISPRQRRHEMLARRSLHHVFVFFFSFMVLCLVFF